MSSRKTAGMAGMRGVMDASMRDGAYWEGKESWPWGHVPSQMPVALPDLMDRKERMVVMFHDTIYLPSLRCYQFLPLCSDDDDVQRRRLQ